MDDRFPRDVEGELGEIQFFSEECPGVYVLSCRQDEGPCREFYLVEETASMIPPGVKELGRRLASCPDLLAYEIENPSGGQKIVEYEVNKFRASQGLPLPDGVTLRDIALDGMELNPEYFGTFPVPSVTPWGCTLRHKAIDNGVYWLETEGSPRVLALCGILEDALSDAARKLAEPGAGEGYLFFQERASCIPLFELMQLYPQWGNSSRIDRKALENAIWRYYPEYAVQYNAQEAAGQHSLMGLTFRSLGDQVDLSASAKQMIALSPGVGTNFCALLE